MFTFRNEDCGTSPLTWGADILGRVLADVTTVAWVGLGDKVARDEI